MGVRLGASVRSSFPDPREGARSMVARAAAAREAGLETLFVGDNHAQATGYLQNSPVLGRMLAEWGDGIAGALYLLPLWHPVLVAEQVQTLAGIAHGPFVMQCAIGEGAERFAAMGVALRGRAGLFERYLDIIRRLLAGEEVTDVELGVREAAIGAGTGEPIQVWIGGQAAPAIDRAARLGDGWIGGPGLSDAEAARLAATYMERCAAHGREPGVVALRRDIHVGATPTEAARVADRAVARGYRGLPADRLVHGTAAEVGRRLAAYGDAGYTDVLIRHISDDHDEVMASYGRLADVRAAMSADS